MNTKPLWLAKDMNIKSLWLASALVVVVVIFTVGTVLYSNRGDDLEVARDQVEQFHKEVASLKQDVKEKDKVIEELQKQITILTPRSEVPKRRDYKLDIKTNASSLIENFGIKAGLSSYIEHTLPKWATEEEFGETYAVWIRNVDRKMMGGKIHMRFDLMIGKRAMIFRESDIIARRPITVPAFDPKVDPRGGDEAIRQKLESYAKTANLSKTGAAILAGVTIGTKVSPLWAMLVFLGKFIPSPDQVQQQKVEGVIVGGIAYANLQEMIVALEN